MTPVPVRYVTGDATSPDAWGPVVIAHVCNDAGAWGAGFVTAVSRRWPQPEHDYRAWYRKRDRNNFALGAVRFVPVRNGLWVANMVGQHGTLSPVNLAPVRYSALGQCLHKLGDWALGHEASVHAPRIGCGLAGGSWDRVGPLIDVHLSQRGVPVTVYDLPRTP